MYKLVVCSFDNTLIDSEEVIPTSTALLFDKLRRDKIKIVITTGRCLKSVLDYNRDFPICDYLVTSNGAYIYDVIKQNVIFKKNIGIRTIKKIIKEFYDKASIYLINNNIWNFFDDGSVSKYNYDVRKITNKDEFLEENKKNIYKIELHFNFLNDLKKAVKKIKMLELNININVCDSNNKYLIEITDKEASMLSGLEKILKREKITKSEIISFGSCSSDIEIIKKSGMGIAMGNAVDKLKKISHLVTLDNDNKGVEYYLKKVYKD